MAELPDLTLYGYWRSSSAWRVRIGLQRKGLAYRYEAVHLMDGAQRNEEHLARNPLGQVPWLSWTGGGLGQSLAILEFLEERFPQPPLLPTDPYLRARCRMLAEVVNSGIQPLQNLRVITHWEGGRAFGKAAIGDGLAALQGLSEPTRGDFLVGDEPTLADVLLVPQLYNARRFDCDLDALQPLLAIEARCEALPWFAAAHPDRQPDAQPA